MPFRGARARLSSCSAHLPLARTQSLGHTQEVSSLAEQSRAQLRFGALFLKEEGERRYKGTVSSLYLEQDERDISTLYICLIPFESHKLRKTLKFEKLIISEVTN